jgi:hypothetical protein
MGPVLAYGWCAGRGFGSPAGGLNGDTHEEAAQFVKLSTS